MLNYIQGVEIKKSPGRGRGVFACKDFQKGELIIVEKAIAEVTDNNISSSIDSLIRKCCAIVDLKGVEALRLSYLYDGQTPFDQLKIPPVEIFHENYYRKYNIPDIPIKKVKMLASLNSFKQSLDQ